MPSRETRDYELNEVSWWAKWVDETVWVSKNCYAMFSEVFKNEWFYNRGGFLGEERVPVDAVEAVEKEFSTRKRATTSILVEEGSAWQRLRATIASRGYVASDKMLVMESKGKFVAKAPNSAVVVSLVGQRKGERLDEWTRAYLSAFYGDQRLNGDVNKIVGKIVGDKKASFVLARMGKMVAGCAALYRTAGVMGAYCIGTVPRSRRKGVAAAMIGFMRGLAAKEKRALILQNMASDEVEGVYLKNGFKLAYSKTLFEKRPKKTWADKKIPSGESFGVVINRSASEGRSVPFKEVFSGFEAVGAVRRLFGSDTEEVLSKLKVSMDPPVGYLRVDGGTGNIILNPEYLRTGHETHIYLDVLHELTHVKQFREGKELYDRRYAYFERPTEIDAYQVAVEEAWRIGLGKAEILEYLKVEWVTPEEFQKFLAMMKL